MQQAIEIEVQQERCLLLERKIEGSTATTTQLCSSAWLLRIILPNANPSVCEQGKRTWWCYGRGLHSDTIKQAREGRKRLGNLVVQAIVGIVISGRKRYRHQQRSL